MWSIERGGVRTNGDHLVQRFTTDTERKEKILKTLKGAIERVGDSFPHHNFTNRNVSLVNSSAPITGQKKSTREGFGGAVHCQGGV